MRRVLLAVGALAVVAALGASAAPNRNPRAGPMPLRKAPVGKIRNNAEGTGVGYPPCDPNVTQRSGYFDIDQAEDKHYFYWMFEARTNPSTAPVVLWMTGGPGCSSSLAMLAENGPCHFNHTTRAMYTNEYSWNNVANVIYIDQPAGVGFSYGNFPSAYDTNETMVSDDMYSFVQAFLGAYPQYQSNPFFVYGESYGGHYAPATAHRIWQGNNANEGIKVNLQGLSTGNGMTVPEVQLSYYANLSYRWCNVVRGEPCISSFAYDLQMLELPGCISQIKGCNSYPTDSNVDCSLAYSTCLNGQLGPFENTGLNVYDIRKTCNGPLCYDFSLEIEFMNLPSVQQSLGVASQGITWQTCNDNVNGMFQNDWMRDFGYCVEDLLNAGIRVLVYAGDMDFICNWLGNKAWTLALDWNQQDSFQAARDYPWWVNDQPAGRVRTVSGGNNNLQFTFLQVHQAGHMVPMDQPERALAMLKHFINDTPFDEFGGPI